MFRFSHTCSAVDAAIFSFNDGLYLSSFVLLRFQCPLHGEQLSSGRKGFISGSTVNRTPGDAVSALGTGEDIVRDSFKPFWGNGDTLSKRLLRNDGKELEKKPLGCREFEIKDTRLEKYFLERPQSS